MSKFFKHYASSFQRDAGRLRILDHLLLIRFLNFERNIGTDFM